MMATSSAPVVDRRWGAGRVGALIAYVFNGFALTSWSVRLPSMRDVLEVGAAEIGIFLTAGAVGTLAMIIVAGRIVTRIGPRRCYTIATAAFLIAYLTLAGALLVQSLPLLIAANVVHGAAFALTNVPQAVLAAGAERQVGRTILPQFHAGYSIGAAVGAAAGGALAAVGVSAAYQFALLVVLALLVRLVVSQLIRGLDADLADERSAAQAAHAASAGAAGAVGESRPAIWTSALVISVGAVVFATAFSEGAANNWAAVALVDAMRIDESTASTAVTAFLIGQTIVRLVGGPLVDRIGRRSALIASAAVALTGVTLFATVPSLPLAVAAAALWGAGSALVVPIGVGIVARDPLAGASRVAAVTSISSAANIAGPPLLGIAGDVFGVRPSLLIVAAVIAATLAAIGPATRPRDEAPTRSRDVKDEP